MQANLIFTARHINESVCIGRMGRVSRLPGVDALLLIFPTPTCLSDPTPQTHYMEKRKN